jgi:O-antigen/teichoic acid export membrane protein
LINEDYKFRDAVNRAARYTAVVVAPIAMALALFSKQAVYVVYGSQYNLAPLYLSIMALSSLLAPFGVVTMYLNIIGATKVTMMLNIVGMMMGLPITWILLVHYGMLGAIVASLINSILGTVVSLITVKRRYSINVEALHVVKYWMPSLIAGALTYLIIYMIENMWLALGIGLAMYLALLTVLIAMMTSAEDLIDLADISRGIRYVGPLINRTLNIVTRIKAML